MGDTRPNNRRMAKVAPAQMRRTAHTTSSTERSSSATAGQRRMTGQLVIYGESHPSQLVWVRNGESIERALARQISLEAVQTRSVKFQPKGKGLESPFSPPRPERSHPRNRATK